MAKSEKLVASKEANMLVRSAVGGSILFVPGDSLHKIEKAMRSAANAIIVDLEDSVSPSAKGEARQIACEVLRQERKMPIAIRVNGADTDWYLQDLAALGAMQPNIVMLPKCTSKLDVLRLDHQLSVLEAQCGTEIGSTAILPLVTETAASLGTMDYRDASPRLCGLGFAGEDLASDLGVRARAAGSMNPLLAQARRNVAIAAAACGVGAIDTPFPDPRDERRLLAETAQAVELGYTGKMCIHPAQIAVVRKAFEPSEETLEWSRAVVHAFAESSSEGVTLLDGKMIDRAHLRLAERNLAAFATG